MRTTSILTTAAIALVAGLGSASAGGQFDALADLTVTPLTNHQMANVRGSGTFRINHRNFNIPNGISDTAAIAICGGTFCGVTMGRPTGP